MSATDRPVRSLIGQEAADWFVVNRAAPTAKERQAFAAWLKVSPVHVEEYLAVSVLARDLRAACEDSPEALAGLLARAQVEEDSVVETFCPRVVTGVRGVASKRWQPAAVMAGFVILSLGLFALWYLMPLTHAPAPEAATVLHFETRHGEDQTRRLSDGSVVHLNTDSAVTIRYVKTERLVTLISGEAVFEVAHEPGRSFLVVAGPAKVVAVGTKFDVRLGHASTTVTVIEGRVAVGPSPMLEKRSAGSNQGRALPFVQLDADQQVSVPEEGGPVTAIAVDAKQATAWLHRQIMFEREPLGRVATEFNRYATKQIEITAPGLRTLEISGVFATDDTEAFIAFLRSLDHVHVEVTATRIRVSQD
jgi:transmembrane sensor